ncbi:MAG: hypothetical protein CBB70_01450 [Planctomycetaceae bacterium TMED10]|nr:MAG: hypothetical protein CBB70_01450 [Planctomycetaceae bacterium TMED10]
MDSQKFEKKLLSLIKKKVFLFCRLTILSPQAKCATSEKLAFVYDTVKHGIQYFAIQRMVFYL